MSSSNGAFEQPSADLGDPILWYQDPMNPRDPVVGWVCQKPGAHTLTLLVFTPTVGFMEKPSVRHKDDPSLIENPNWRQWGCWEHAPWFQKLQRVGSSMTAAIAASEKSSKRGNN
jgi:hypothetical protein